MRKTGLSVALFLAIFSPGVASSTSSISIVDAQVYLAPTTGDYDLGYVTAEGVSGIRVQVTTDNPAGAILYVKCVDASPEIVLNDLLVKSSTNGSLIAAYTAITSSDQALWSKASTFTDYPVDTDVKIQNIWNYSDAAGGGTTDYTNTLTYTIVEQ